MARKTDIRLRRSATAGNAPSTSDLNTGEIALNTDDGALFYKRTTGGSDSIVVAADARTLNLDYTNQKVGIKNASPSDELHVAGVIRTHTSATSKYIRLFGGNSGNFLDSYGNTLFLRPAGSTANSTRLDGSGNLMVGGRLAAGTTLPETKLHIANGSDTSAAVTITGGHVGRRLKIQSFQNNSLDGAGFIFNADSSSGALKFQTTSTDRMIITQPGNVGIGTTSPGDKLHVYDGNIQIQTPSGSGGRYISLNNTHTGGRDYRLISTNDSHGSLGGGDFAILDNDVSGNDAAKTRLLIDNSGNVGIGTTHADSKLDVTGGDITVNTTGTGFMNFKYSNSSKGTIGTDGIDLKITAAADLQLLPASNVGIGTASPSRKLHVNGSGATIAVKVEATDGSQASLDLSNSEGDFRIINDGGTLQFYDDADSAERMRIDTSGNLCIGNTSGAAKIDVRTDDGYGLRLESSSGHYFRVAHGGGTEIAGDVTLSAGALTVAGNATFNGSLEINHNPLILDTNPAATYGVSEALRIDDSAGTNDRALQIYEFLHSGGRHHRLTFNTNITTTGSAYTYTQGNYGGSSQIQFGNSGEIVFFTNPQDTGGSATAITPLERFRVNSDGDVRFEGGNLFYDASQNALNFIDNVPAQFGAANDLQISHNGTDSAINNVTGDLYITNKADDKDIIFRSDDGSGGFTEYLRLDGSLAGSGLTFVRLPDGGNLGFGGNNDLRIFHDGSNTSINNFTGDLNIRNDANDGDITLQSDDGSGGVATYLRIDGNNTNIAVSKTMLFADSAKASFGAAEDLRIVHDGSNSTIDNYQGDLLIRQQVNDKDIIFQSDNGSGGTADYIRLDGDTGNLNLYHYGSLKFNTTATGVNITGNTVISGDLTVNGTNTVLNTTTLDVEDLNITVAKGAADSAAANGAGLTIEGPTNNASMIWDHGNQYFEFNKDVFSGNFIIGTTGTNVGRMYNSSGVMALEAYTSRQISFGNATNGEHVRIDATGNVAIGTNGTLSAKTVINVNAAGTQAALLLNNAHGYGSGVGTAATALQFARDNSPTNGQGIIGAQIHSGNENETTSNPQNLIFSTKSGTSPYNLTEAMRISSQQRVGIGTTSPSQKLDVQGTILVNNEIQFVNSAMRIFRSSDDMRLRTGSTDRLTIKSTGNVGIRNTSPQENLTIGSANNQGDIGFHIGGHRLITFGYMPSNSNNATYAGYPAEIRHDPTTGVLRFGIDTVSRTVGNAANLTTVLTISKDARVGIGETSPDAKLHIMTASNGASTVGNASDELILENSTDCGLTIRSGSSSDGVISFADADDHNVGQIYYSHGTNDMTFRTNDSIAMSINASGNVGIGSSSASPTLTLNKATTGAAKIDFDNAGNIKARIELDSAENLQFKTGGTPTERLEITETGVIKFNNAYTFPTADGTAGQVLKTDGSGALTFQNDSGGGSAGTSIADADNDTKIQVEESSDEDVIRMDTAGTERIQVTSNGLNVVGSGGYRVAGTEVISSSRNIANIGTITSGKIEGTTADNNGHILKTDSSTANAADVALQLRNSSSDYNLKFQPRLPAGNMHSQVNADDFGIFTSNSKGISIGNNDKSLVGISPTEGIELSTNNTRRVTILNDGNVGIGTTSPSSLLHLSSGSYPKITLNDETGVHRAFSVGTNNETFTIRNETASGDAFKIDNANNAVFMSLLSIQSKLMHDGDTDNYFSFAAADTQSFVTGNSTRLQITNSLVRLNQENNNQDFAVYSSNSDHMLYVDASADAVGIGTASPTAVLDVVGPAARPTSLAEVDTGSTARFRSDSSNADSLYIAEAASGALIQVNDGATNSTTAKPLALQPFGGNVGIGTTAPSFTNGGGLEIERATSATLRIQRAGADAGELFMDSTGFNLKDLSSGKIIFGTTNAERMRLTDAGLGIGTTAPTGKLHISGNSDVSDEDCQLIIDDVDGSAGSRIPSIQFRSVTGGTTTNQGRIRATDTQGMVLSGSSGQGDDLVVTASGVGIGTTSVTSGAGLDVNGGSILTRNLNNASVRVNSTSNAYMIIDRSAANRRSALVFSTAASNIMTNPPATGTIDWALGVSDSDELTGDKFCITKSNTNFSGAALVIDSSNRVGIGNTSPSKPLDVQFSGDAGARIKSTDNHASLYIDAHSGYGEYIRFSQAGSNKYWINVDTNGKMLFRPTATGTEGNIITFDSSGQVGIGKTTVKAKLQVEELGIETTNTTTSATTQVTLASLNITHFRSAKFTIQVTNSTDSTYQTTELLALHDGTTANITEFGTLITGAAAEATFDAAITSGFFRLQATPASTDTMVFKVVSYAITV